MRRPDPASHGQPSAKRHEQRSAGIGRCSRPALGSLARALLAVALVAPVVPSQVESARERIPGILETMADAGYVLDAKSLVVEVLSVEESRPHFERQQDRMFAAGHFEGLAGLAGALDGLPPRSPDAFRELVVENLSARVAAYYDPDRSAIVLVEEWAHVMENDGLLAHELAHAVRDRTNPLLEFMQAAHESVDRMHVRMTVIEGDAELARMAFVYQRSGRSMDEVTEEMWDLSAASTSANDGLLSTYEAGGRLALRHFRAGGLAAVDQLFTSPPASTEQVLHAEKADDVPTQLPLPVTDLPLVYETTLGELVIRGLLRSVAGSVVDGTRAAAGWDGDTLRVLRTPDGGLAIQWRTLWDREQDAHQFAELIESKQKGTGVLTRHERLVDWVAADDPKLRAQLSTSLAEALPELAPNTDDALSAEAVEARLDATPFLHEGYWVHPGYGLRIPAPEDCTPRFSQDHHILAWPPVDDFVDNVAVHRSILSGPLPAETVATRFAENMDRSPAFQVTGSGTREIQGRTVAEVTFVTVGSARSETARVIGIPRQDDALWIVFTVITDRLEERHEDIEAVIDGILVDD